MKWKLCNVKLISSKTKGEIYNVSAAGAWIHTVFVCIRQGSKRNDDSVSVEELVWSAESQVLIPAEHLWCDFKWRPWAKNSSPNTNDLYIHYMDKSTGTPPSLEEKKALPNCGNCKLKNCISTSVQPFCSVWNDCTHMYPYVIGVWWWIFGSRSAFKVTPEDKNIIIYLKIKICTLGNY